MLRHFVPRNDVYWELILVLRATKAKKSKLKKAQRVALVVSLFNDEISRALQMGAVATLKDAGLTGDAVKVFEVAGAFEIPLVAKKIALTKKYAGVIALGCVIRGDTPHFEFVSLAATQGCLQVSLDTLVPVACGVLTVNTVAQAKERAAANEFNKGREAALALLDTLSTLEKI